MTFARPLAARSAKPVLRRPSGVIHRMPTPRRAHRSDKSFECFDKAVDHLVEIALEDPLRLDLLDRVNDGGVVLSSKPLADLGKGGIRERLAQVHRHLARKRDLL